jgi:nucleoside-diphosphate-sugar epimerase
MKPQLHLILGDGVMGLALAAELAQRKLPHALASRSPSASLPSGTPHRTVDARDAAQLLQLCADASHVYMTLGLAYDTRVWQRDWPPIVENLLAAARVQGFKLVFFDNVYPYGPAPLRVPMTEDHPQQPPSRKGAVRKALDDRLLRAMREEGLQALVARSADFYGPDVRNSALFHAAIERQLRGQKAQWLGDPDALHSFTYTLDAALGMVMLALEGDCYGQAWHLPTAQPAPTARQLLNHSARLLGAPEGVLRMPRPALALLKWFVPVLREVQEMNYQFERDYVFSSEKFMARFPGFPVTPYGAGMEGMVGSLRASGAGG